MQIEERVVCGSGIHFEVAGVDDDAQGSGDGQRHRAHNGVRNVDELDGERADFDALLRLHRAKIRIFSQFVLVQAGAPPERA